MGSPTRGALKIALGAGALYFLVMRNLETAAEWYNQRYLQKIHERELMRSIAQEKAAMIQQSN